MLQVSGAFHTPLMQPAVEGMKKVIGALDFKKSGVPLVANTTAAVLTEPDEIKEELIRQLTSAVQWQRSIEFMISNGVTTFIEIGPGKVLSGLMRRINRSARALNVGEPGEMKNISG
jgi:[acyl-carrier-protein] S-malonyltransferase